MAPLTRTAASPERLSVPVCTLTATPASPCAENRPNPGQGCTTGMQVPPGHSRIPSSSKHESPPSVPNPSCRVEADASNAPLGAKSTPGLEIVSDECARALPPPVDMPLMSPALWKKTALAGAPTFVAPAEEEMAIWDEVWMVALVLPTSTTSPSL